MNCHTLKIINQKPRPIVSSLRELIITRGDDSATIQYKGAAYGTNTLRIGPEVESKIQSLLSPQAPRRTIVIVQKFVGSRVVGDPFMVAIPLNPRAASHRDVGQMRKRRRSMAGFQIAVARCA